MTRLRRNLVAALRDHLEGAPPAPPLAGVPIWQAFCALSEGRRWSEAGPDPIRPADVAAWAELHGRHVPRHHAAILFALDAAWLEWARMPKERRVTGRLTAARFDAMFG